jgi:hypothetical protein
MGVPIAHSMGHIDPFVRVRGRMRYHFCVLCLVFNLLFVEWRPGYFGGGGGLAPLTRRSEEPPIGHATRA